VSIIDQYPWPPIAPEGWRVTWWSAEVPGRFAVDLLHIETRRVVSVSLPNPYDWAEVAEAVLSLSPFDVRVTVGPSLW